MIRRALQSGPEFLEKVGPGLLVTTDVKQSLDEEGKPSLLVELGTTVRIRRPDGSVIDRMVAGVEIWREHVGLFFPNVEQHEIPISSEMELSA
jgi:hypothetical protein